MLLVFYFRKCQDKEDKKLSFLELLVQERNLKRRRAKHRGVHTNKKSHTEILREVINQQMEIYGHQITEMRSICHDAKAVDIVKTPSSNRHSNDATQNSPLSFNGSSSRHRNNLFQDSQDYRGSSNSRNDHMYEYSETIHASWSKDREKHSRTTTESWKVQKERKRRRSHSRERNYDRKNKHWRTRQDYNRDNMKSREAEKSFDGTSYFKRSVNR